MDMKLLLCVFIWISHQKCLIVSSLIVLLAHMQNHAAFVYFLNQHLYIIINFVCE